MLVLVVLSGLTSLVPARWNSNDPKSLELLRSGPVNCIQLEHPNWTPALLRAARQQHIETFGVIRPGAQSVEQAREAARLKLDGVVLEGEYDSPALEPERAAVAGLTVVGLASRGRMRLDGGDAIMGTWQGLWPGIQIEHGGGSATAGPTSTPWINTNTGFLRFARAATDSAVCVGEPCRTGGSWISCSRSGRPPMTPPSARIFGVRTFNTASVLFQLLAEPDGKSLLVHLVNYADYAAEDVTVQVLGQWRRARLYSPEGETRELQLYPVADGTGIDIDRIGMVATLLLD